MKMKSLLKLFPIKIFFKDLTKLQQVIEILNIPMNKMHFRLILQQAVFKQRRNFFKTQPISLKTACTKEERSYQIFLQITIVLQIQQQISNRKIEGFEEHGMTS